jgi:4-hydroxy-4-methyl-2-oxoglutarate aldolase
MNNQRLSEKFSELSTPLIADACLRLKIPLRLAPSGIRPLMIESHIAGKVLPVRHYGSVGVFLEAMEGTQQGNILVIDNEGRMDEGCIGDLTVTPDDIVFADADGVLFAPAQGVDEILSTADSIWKKER